MPERTRRPVTASLLALALLVGLAQGEGEISVSGSGVAFGTPDMAIIELGHSTSDADVGAALARADAAVRAVRVALEALGVAPLDVRTTTYTVWREERWSDRGVPVEPLFRVTHLLEVVVRDVEQVGAVIVGATAAGANQIGGLRFTVDDPRALEATARRLAFEAAREVAEQLAALAGATLGRATDIAEHSATPRVPVAERAVMVLADAEAAAPVSGGQLAVVVRLEVRFALLHD
jgi:uncharacterized protein